MLYELPLGHQQWKLAAGDQSVRGCLEPGDDPTDYLQGASLGPAPVDYIAHPLAADLKQSRNVNPQRSFEVPNI